MLTLAIQLSERKTARRNYRKPAILHRDTANGLSILGLHVTGELQRDNPAMKLSKPQ
jgi:hypothetical protein